MTGSTTRRAKLTALAVAGSLLAAAPAAAEPNDGGATKARDNGQIVLRRDGSKAVPFVPYTRTSATAPRPDGFDWGDAAIGAGVASVMLVASGTVVLTRRRRQASIQPTIPA
jgi:hypothetical protein